MGIKLGTLDITFKIGSADTTVYLGDTMIQSGDTPTPPTPRLPSGYTEVEYVENTGNSSVNLGIQLMANANDSFSIEYNRTMTYTRGWGDLQTMLTCCKEVSPYPGWYERFHNNGANLQIDGWFGGSSSSPTLTTGVTQVSGDVYHTSISLATTPSNATHNYPLNLFSSLDSNQQPWRFCKGKVYADMTVIYNGNQVRFLIPCTRDSDSVAGLYDLVNDVFYSSVTNTPLVAGDPV